MTVVHSADGHPMDTPSEGTHVSLTPSVEKQPDGEQHDGAQPDEEFDTSTEAATGAPHSEAPSAPASVIVEPTTENGVALDWYITDDANPFHRRLLVNDAAGPLVDLFLDPLVVQDLIASLSMVHNAQRTAMGLTPVTAQASETHLPEGLPEEHEVAHPHVRANATSQAQGSTVNQGRPDTATTAPTAGPTTITWWWRHKLLAFLLVFAAVFFVHGTVTGTR